VRAVVFWLAVAVAVLVTGSRLIRLPDAVSLGVVTGAILLLRFVPISWTRERPITFAAPLVFAALLWCGTGVALWSALLSHFVPGTLGPSRRQLSRNAVRFQGAQLALAALAAAALPGRLPLLLGYPGLPHAAPLTYTASLIALRYAALAALTFLLVALLLAICAGPGVHRVGFRATLWQQLRLLLPVYAPGLFPLVLLAPLGATVGVAVGLPALLLLLLSAQVTRLSDEVTGMQGQLKTAEAMGRASLTDTDTLEESVLLERFLLLSRDLVQADRALIWMLDGETNELTPAAALPNKGPFLRQTAQLGEGLIGHAAIRKKPRLVQDAARDPHRGQRETASGTWLLYPLVIGEEVMGVAQWMRPSSRPYSHDDIARLDSLVPQATIALENIHIRARMHHLAATDGLTGLWNQSKMADLLRDEQRRAQRYQRVLSILMLDVDSFKTFNVTYGHPQGDHLLRNIAAILRANVRTVDTVGRYGGEEFLIVLPETTKDAACRLAERIRGAVEERGHSLPDGVTVYRTISIGVASYPEDALNPIELVERADEAVYRAKRSGKNRVIWA
jgi:diguanylate cyclase (GGDEF)-like protein